MRDWLPALGILIGFATGFAVQERDRQATRATMFIIAADNETLRDDAKALRARCPARPRMQRNIVFRPGVSI